MAKLTSALRTSRLLLCGALCLAGGLITSPIVAAAPPTTFTNPVYENGADPWLLYYNGNYYSTTTTWSSQLAMRKSPTLAGLADATPVNVWSETNPDRCCNFWAFEFHHLQGPDGWRWYMLYTSGHDGTYDYQHLSVLESAGDDPMGPYTYKGSPMANSYNIDGSYITIKGQLYLMYSQWQGDEQRNFIIKMTNPWTTTGEPTLLTRPALDWERIGLNVNEGPEPLVHDGRVFVTYSGSYCETADYKLGLLELTGEDPLDPDAWTKYDEPVFTQGNGVYGPGHNGFFTSPDGTEDWLAYHGNADPDDGCGTGRALRAQPFTWNSDGTPHFGEPVGADTPLPVPSGENGPMWVHPNDPMMRFNYYRPKTDAPADEPQFTPVTAEPRQIDFVGNGQVRLADYAGQFLTSSDCGGTQGFQPWTNQQCQRWQFNVNNNGLLTLTSASNGERYKMCSEEHCDQFALSPLGSVAIVSGQSGKVLTVADGTTVQEPWTGAATQKWWLTISDDGTVNMLADSNTTQCLRTTDGLQLELGQCSGPASQWYLRPRSEGGYTLASRVDNRVLDLTNCDLHDGTAIGVFDNLDNICQRFYLRETE